jgi:hypothetical protein
MNAKKKTLNSFEIFTQKGTFISQFTNRWKLSSEFSFFEDEGAKQLDE